MDFSLTRRHAGLALAAAFLAACNQKTETGEPITPGSLQWAASGEWRLDPERDVYRHPVETLEFWGIAPGMTVLEILPGRGWMTAILAPYLRRSGGKLIVASFDPATASQARRETMADFDGRFLLENRFGIIERTIVSATAPELAPAGSVDLAILANNLHTLMAEGIAERVMAQVFAALKPGGVFGIEQHRALSKSDLDPTASNGYVQEAHAKKIAEEAGFVFVSASDINANPKDDRDHPFGVWTLPPTLRTAPLGSLPDRDFDSQPFVEIGESDRMTLKFRKPAP
jgi:predicted methyltransferase